MTDFYSQLADDYDTMTRFDTRLTGMRNTLSGLVERYNIDTALDVACGTGIATLALAQLGVEVTGTDLNPEMIERARANADQLELSDVTFDVAGMHDSFPAMQHDYDAVFCIGNSIPHVLFPKDFLATCVHFHSILKPGGRAIIQLKNFEMLVKKGERFVGAHRQGNREYIRFYDFIGDTLAFNILRVDWDGDKAVKHDMITTTLKPYIRKDFEQVMGAFSDVSFCADLNGDPFSPETSSDLVVVATR